jgi:hypothetical protein
VGLGVDWLGEAEEEVMADMVDMSVGDMVEPVPDMLGKSPDGVGRVAEDKLAEAMLDDPVFNEPVIETAVVATVLLAEVETDDMAVDVLVADVVDEQMAGSGLATGSAAMIPGCRTVPVTSLNS